MREEFDELKLKVRLSVDCHGDRCVAAFVGQGYGGLLWFACFVGAILIHMPLFI
ncbi:hypothetical protein BCR43DRAFT_485486, partial [Syncephalastrum racemosum]